MSDEGKRTFASSAQFVLQAIVLALLLWIGQTVLTLRDASLEQKYKNINQELRDTQIQKEVADVRSELQALRVQVGAIATNTAASAASAAIASQAAENARGRVKQQ